VPTAQLPISSRSGKQSSPDVSPFRGDLPWVGTLPGVAAWDPDAEITHPVDFRLVHNTFVTMYWRSSLLDETIEWLRSHGYDVVEFDAASWASAAEMFDDVAAGLDFPAYFGRNLDALNDCMRDVASGEYGWHADATGLVLVL
jgi:Barstar (barnase inhibitor)